MVDRGLPSNGCAYAASRRTDMKRDEERHSPEPQELGIASVETKGLGWQAPEVGGYEIHSGISDD